MYHLLFIDQCVVFEGNRIIVTRKYKYYYWYDILTSSATFTLMPKRIHFVLVIMIKKYHEDVLDLEEGLLSGSFDKLAILWDAAFGSSFLFDILARHNS